MLLHDTYMDRSLAAYFPAGSASKQHIFPSPDYLASWALESKHVRLDELDVSTSIILCSSYTYVNVPPSQTNPLLHSKSAG